MKFSSSAVWKPYEFSDDSSVSTTTTPGTTGKWASMSYVKRRLGQRFLFLRALSSTLSFSYSLIGSKRILPDCRIGSLAECVCSAIGSFLHSVGQSRSLEAQYYEKHIRFDDSLTHVSTVILFPLGCEGKKAAQLTPSNNRCPAHEFILGKMRCVKHFHEVLVQVVGLNTHPRHSR